VIKVLEALISAQNFTSTSENSGHMSFETTPTTHHAEPLMMSFKNVAQWDVPVEASPGCIEEGSTPGVLAVGSA
jgi:hypothetical protein